MIAAPLSEAYPLQQCVDLPGSLCARQTLECRHIFQIVLHREFRVKPEFLRQIPQLFPVGRTKRPNLHPIAQNPATAGPQNARQHPH